MEWQEIRVAAAAFVGITAMACGGSDSSTPTPVPSVSPSPAACGAGAPVAGIPTLSARLVVSGLQSPLDLQIAAGDRERLYVVEQGGRIRVIRGGQLQPTPFLDVGDRISSGGERGLLGLAFHPQFAQNRRFFVNYTDPQGDTHISEFRAPSPDAADPASERLLLFVAQPFANHNGGGLAFGNDGTLLIGLGDGGSGGDPKGNGQNLGTRLGKLLRIDVDGAVPYAIPADNPFRTRVGALPEIWAYGLRNPFRFSVDRPTGDVYIGDVGQARREEIDVIPGGHGGQNFGWNITEGTLCYKPTNGCDTAGITMPVLDYGHSDGCSVIGGVVYRGCRMPDLAGTYFYGDYCTGFVRSFRLANGRATALRDWTPDLRGIDSITSFGTDADGEVYVVDPNGEVFELVPAG